MDHQALAQMLGNYREFVGAIAVAVTLIYLAVQVRHSSRGIEINSVFRGSYLYPQEVRQEVD